MEGVKLSFLLMFSEYDNQYKRKVGLITRNPIFTGFIRRWMINRSVLRMQCLKINTIAAVIMSNDSGYPVYCFSLGLWGIESRLRDLYNTSALLKEPVIHILLKVTFSNFSHHDQFRPLARDKISRVAPQLSREVSDTLHFGTGRKSYSQRFQNFWKIKNPSLDGEDRCIWTWHTCPFSMEMAHIENNFMKRKYFNCAA